MELICWFGRLARGNVDLCGGQVGHHTVRGQGDVATRVDRRVREFEGARRGAYRPRDGADVDLAVDRAQRRAGFGADHAVWRSGSVSKRRRTPDAVDNA